MSLHLTVHSSPYPLKKLSPLSLSLPSHLNTAPTHPTYLRNGFHHLQHLDRVAGYRTKKKVSQALVSFLAIATTLIVTASILFWNYSETRHRRLTKKPNRILDHWGKRGPLLDKEQLGSINGGLVYYGETALRYQPCFLAVTFYGIYDNRSIKCYMLNTQTSDNKGFFTQ